MVENIAHIMILFKNLQEMLFDDWGKYGYILGIKSLMPITNDTSLPEKDEKIFVN